LFSGRISTVAGVDSSCDCAVQECDCSSGDGNFARSASLHNPSAIACTPDGSLYVADQLNLRIRKVYFTGLSGLFIKDLSMSPVSTRM